MDADKALRNAAERMKDSLAREPIPEAPRPGCNWRPVLVGAVAAMLVTVGTLVLFARVGASPSASAPETSDLPPVSLGETHVWPETSRQGQPSELVVAFAKEVLGWQSPAAWPEAQVEASEPVWVRLSPERVGVPLDVLTVPAPDGGRVLAEVRVAWGSTTKIRALSPDQPGSVIVLVGVGGAETAEVTMRLTGGRQIVLTADRSDIGNGRLEVPDVSDPQEIRTVLIRWIDGENRVIAATSSSTPSATAADLVEDPVPSSLEGVWRPMPASPLGGREAAHAFWTGGELLVMGGSDAAPCPPGARCLSPDVPALRDGAAFDLVTGEWREIASSPVPLGYGSGLVHQGVVYLWVYGFEARPGSETAFLAYDVDEDSWERLPMPASVPTPAALGEMGDSLILYQSTQENGVGVDLLFDPQTREWSVLPADPLQPSFDRTMVWTGDELVLFGIEAMPQPGSAKPAFYRAATYDVAIGTWRRLPDSEVIGWSPTWYPTAGGIINPSVGSSDGGEVNNYGRFYPYGGVLGTAAGVWEPLPDPPGRRAGFTGHTAGSSDLLLNNEGWVFDVSGRRWLPLDEPPNTTGAGSAVTWAGSDLVVWGGVAWDKADGELLDSGWMWRPDR